MNTRLKFALRTNSEKGFALPLAVLTGLILIATGIALIMRAQGDQSKVVAQKARSDGLTGTEAGLTQVQDYLNTVRIMALYPSYVNNCVTNSTAVECWRNAQIVSAPQTSLQKALVTLQTSTRCGNSSDSTISTKLSQLVTLSNNNWVDLGSQRYYRLVSYQFQPVTTASSTNSLLGQGLITLEGRSRRATSDSTSDNAEARNRLVVSIPVQSSRPVAFSRETAPALWISTGGAEDSGNTVNTTSGSYSNGSWFQGDVVMSDGTAFVESTGTLRSNLECYMNTNYIKQPSSPSPTVSPNYKAQFFNSFAINNPNAKTLSFPALPTIATVEARVPTAQKITDLNNSVIFPRGTDTATSISINGQSVSVYEYVFDNINLTGNNTITITAGRKVVFYVKGNISTNGNAGIIHDCSNVSDCNTADLQIFAYKDATVLGIASPEICLKGNQNLEAFIFAPDYALGKKGNGNFKGSLWGKTWGKISDCSDNSKITITQGARWDGLIQNFLPSPLAEIPQIGQVMTWCEESVDTNNSDTDTSNDTQCTPSMPTN